MLTSTSEDAKCIMCVTVMSLRSQHGGFTGRLGVDRDSESDYARRPGGGPHILKRCRRQSGSVFTSKLEIRENPSSGFAPRRVIKPQNCVEMSWSKLAIEAAGLQFEPYRWRRDLGFFPNSRRNKRSRSGRGVSVCENQAA